MNKRSRRAAAAVILAFAVLLGQGSLAVAAGGGVYASLSTGMPVSPNVSPEGDVAATGIAKGKFLVAGPRMNDPLFFHAVVLIVAYNGSGVAGLIVNHPARITLSHALRDFKALKDSTDQLYLGGPVRFENVTLLVRAGRPPQDALQVIGDVYFSASPDAFRSLFDGQGAPEAFRVYAGYAGWSHGQLLWEISVGGWKVIDADPGVIFDNDPEGLWSRLAGEP